MATNKQPRPNDKRVVYFNVGTGRETETIDHLDAADFETDKKWRWEADRLRREYWLTGQYPRLSQRACKAWKE